MKLPLKSNLIIVYIYTNHFAFRFPGDKWQQRPLRIISTDFLAISYIVRFEFCGFFTKTVACNTRWIFISSYKRVRLPKKDNSTPLEPGILFRPSRAFRSDSASYTRWFLSLLLLFNILIRHKFRNRRYLIRIRLQ